MLRAAFRLGLAATRAAGWRGFATAFLSYVPLLGLGALAGAVPPFPGLLLNVSALVLHVVVLVALARLLGAWRPEPLPEVPQVDAEGHRILAPPNPRPPVSYADRSPFVALRNAFRLLRACVSLTGLFVLAGLGAGLAAVALSGGRIGDYGPNVQLAAVLPMTALFTAFVVLATQRVALEGDPRVLVGAAHSVRIARTSYGALLLLSLAEPAVAAIGTLALPGENPPLAQLAVVATVTVLVATVVKVVGTAVANEMYLAGPRLDLPAEAVG